MLAKSSVLVTGGQGFLGSYIVKNLHAKGARVTLFDVKKDDIVLADELYMATNSGFIETIARIKDSYNSVAVFSHNPGITEFA